MKSGTFVNAVWRQWPMTGICTQNEARIGVQLRADSVQSVRMVFSCGIGRLKTDSRPYG